MKAFLEGNGFTISREFKEDELSLAIEWLYKTMRVNGAFYGNIKTDIGFLYSLGKKK